MQNMRFISPEPEPRIFDFEGESSFQTELYGPKVRISNMDDIKTSVKQDVNDLVQLLIKGRPTKEEFDAIKKELKDQQFPVKWENVSEKQYVDIGDLKADRLALNALVYSRSLALDREMSKPIQGANGSFIALTTAENLLRNNGDLVLDLQNLRLVSRDQ